MREDNFYKDSFILTISNIATGIFGFIFSVILSKKLGAEGMGLYGLIMPIYNLFICLICGGMIAAISKVSAVYYAKKDYKNLNRTIKTSLTFDIIWSSLILFFFFIFSSYISSNIIKDSRSIYAVKVLCPAMLFIAISNILKGYFYGISKVKIPALIDILEKALRILFIYIITSFIPSNDIKTTVTAAYVTLALGEFISTALLYFFYKLDIKNQHHSLFKLESRSQLLFDVLIISLPLCLNGFLSTALDATAALIVPRRLVTIGFDYSTALSMIGKFTGMTFTIIFFPLIIINSITTILIPDLSKSLNKKDYWAMEQRIHSVLKIAFLLGLSTSIICLTIPNELGLLFFKRNDLGSYIKFTSIAAPFTYPASVTYGILNGLGKQNMLLRNSLLVAVEDLLLLYFLTGISSINVYGYALALLITSITSLILNFYEINKNCSLNFSLANFIIYILISTFIFLILDILNKLLPNSLPIFKWIFIIAFCYALFYTLSSIIKKKEG